MVISFEKWMEQVNKEVLAKTGMDSRDLPDVCYRDMWEDDYTPKTAAKKAIRNAQFY